MFMGFVFMNCVQTLLPGGMSYDAIGEKWHTLIEFCGSIEEMTGLRIFVARMVPILGSSEEGLAMGVVSHMYHACDRYRN